MNLARNLAALAMETSTPENFFQTKNRYLEFVLQLGKIYSALLLSQKYPWQSKWYNTGESRVIC